MNKVVRNGLLLAAAVLAVAAVAVSFGVDNMPPEITFSEATISYTQGESEEKLLEGITAKDNKDGDVTNSIMVESISELEDSGKALVFYVARDHNNNVSRNSREVAYTGTALQQPTEEATTEPATAAVTVSANSPVLTLSTDSVNILQGSTFTATNYILKIEDDKDSQTTLMRRVTVNGSVNTRTVGTYSVEISCRDSDGNTSLPQTLTVHVVAQ